MFIDNELLEERANTNMYEAGLETLAHKALGEARKNNIKLRQELQKPEYKELNTYWSYDKIVDDVLRYAF